MSFMLDLLPIIGPLRRRRALINAEAIALIRTSVDDEAAYKAARELMRRAREQGDRNAEILYSKVAVTIAAVTGRAIGKGISPRYAQPTHRIDGEQIVRPDRPPPES
jgi:hypothetical protein